MEVCREQDHRSYPVSGAGPYERRIAASDHHSILCVRLDAVAMGDGARSAVPGW